MTDVICKECGHKLTRHVEYGGCLVIDCWCEMCGEDILRAEIDALRAELDAAKAVLEQYADKKNWESSEKERRPWMKDLFLDADGTFFAASFLAKYAKKDGDA